MGNAPDLVIEIISENTAYRDLVQKKRLYVRFRVKEYWIVIPDKGNAYVVYKTYNKDDTLELPL